MTRLFPEEASSIAVEVDRIYLVLIGLTAFFTLLVAVPLIYFAIRYRRGSSASRASPSSGSLRLEIGWTIVPLILALALFAWGATVYVEMQRIPAKAIQIHVVAQQWMWKLQHTSGYREIDELHVPVGEPVRLLMTSRDVIHSFYVPAFRIKQDLVPGRYTSAWFVASKAGVYDLYCAEYCGTNHSKMRGRIVAMEPEDYSSWLAASPSVDSMAASGERLFRAFGCSGCHENPRSTVPAPALKGLFGRPVPLAEGGFVKADEAYLRDSILMPAAHIVAGFENLMPTYEGQLDEEQILQVVAYIRSLAHSPPDLRPLPPE